MAPKQRGVHVSLRNVTPVVPEDEGERAMLKSDLYGIGCVGLLERSWNLKDEEFVQQFVLIREQKLERNNILTALYMTDRKSGPLKYGGRSTTSYKEEAGWPTGWTNT